MGQNTRYNETKETTIRDTSCQTNFKDKLLHKNVSLFPISILSNYTVSFQGGPRELHMNLAHCGNHLDSALNYSGKYTGHLSVGFSQ
jgi:hypothetical protein